MLCFVFGRTHSIFIAERQTFFAFCHRPLLATSSQDSLWSAADHPLLIIAGDIGFVVLQFAVVLMAADFAVLDSLAALICGLLVTHSLFGQPP